MGSDQDEKGEGKENKQRRWARDKLDEEERRSDSSHEPEGPGAQGKKTQTERERRRISHQTRHVETFREHNLVKEMVEVEKKRDGRYNQRGREEKGKVSRLGGAI
ncbi:uncharacterized protein BO97DRAFT_96040 [Aspergillus homomorphus CBS 101889]|uniref:Uncharacterized protein n=1 Tax=Aspergillus homomorphus (strain CBS 101889) TaxID=1450537 RepID=A0A395HVA5_ASPHC|nr:hypothetical protein BO97DRAFT_96040 [Aspergillus homomorphus CBS 101889]RAL11459.1 hypothetical protein BO97DRAFT_96040 [Aspergillus homomorphus CBS 101889]